MRWSTGNFVIARRRHMRKKEIYAAYLLKHGVTSLWKNNMSIIYNNELCAYGEYRVLWVDIWNESAHVLL